MAKLPVDVTAKEWKKARPLTLKEPGLEKKLQAWETERKNLDSKTSLDGFKKCAQALKEVVDASKAAQKACNKTLHKDAIAFLGGYVSAVAKVSTKLQKQGEEYMVKVKAWSKKRSDCLAGMQKLSSGYQTLDEKFKATMKTCEDSVKAGKHVDKSVKLAATLLKEIAEFRKKAQAVIDIVRIDDPNTRIHVDDRAQKFIDMFTKSIQIQSGFEGGFNTMNGALEKFIKTNK